MSGAYPLIFIRSLAQGIASQKEFAEAFPCAELITGTWPLSRVTLLSVEAPPPESWEATIITSTHALAWLGQHTAWLEKMRHKPVYVMGVSGYGQAQALGCTKVIMAGPTAPDLAARVRQDRTAGHLHKEGCCVYLRGAVVRHDMAALVEEHSLVQHIVYAQAAIMTPPPNEVATWLATPHQIVGVAFYALSSVEAWWEGLQQLAAPPTAHLEAWCLSATIAQAIQQRPNQGGFKTVHHPATPTPEALVAALRGSLRSGKGPIRDSIIVHS